MPDIARYVQEIGTRLWDRGGALGSGRAAVMVGSGFSRNARRTSAVADTFPGWEDVAKALVERLYPRCKTCTCAQGSARPDCRVAEKRHRRMASVRESSGALKLGEMYQAVYGRSALESVLTAIVPNSQHEPGELHHRLMALPWSDVFTTNWDTLLETAIDAYDRSYAVVYSVHHIPIVNPPQIVKLHGTLKGGGRLIFTEQDFQSYPRDFAPFVSLVQQSMLENAFVLIGFSGEDPNFLKWLDWCKHQLGEYLHQIYLVDIYDLDEPEARLLTRRGVIPLNIRSLVKGKPEDASYADALAAFFDALDDCKAIVRADAKWPVLPLGAAQEEWGARLNRMPLWLALPGANRESLLASLGDEQRGLPKLLAEVMNPAAAVAAEKSSAVALRAGQVVRLHELARIPHSEATRKTLTDWRAALVGTPGEPSAPNAGQLNAGQLNDGLSRLDRAGREAAALALLGLARQQRRQAGCEAPDTGVLEFWKLARSMAADSEVRLGAAHDEALWSLCLGDPLQALQAAEALARDQTDIGWALRRAAILAEMEYGDAAKEAYEAATKAVRKLRFPVDKPHKTVWKLSRECWAYYAYRCVLVARRGRRGIASNRPSTLDPAEELGRRLDERSRPEADPRAEIREAEARLIEAAYRARLRYDHDKEPASICRRPVADPGIEDPALCFLMLAETVGLPLPLVRHTRIGVSMPLAVTAAATLWRNWRALAVGTLIRCAEPAHLRTEPLPIVDLIGDMDLPGKLWLVERLDEVSTRLLRASAAATMLRAEYLAGRFAVIASLLQAVLGSEGPVDPELRARVWTLHRKWHDHPALGRLPKAFNDLRALQHRLVATADGDWAACLTGLFDLEYARRRTDCWALERWPDPFEALVQRSCRDSKGSALYDYELSETGRAAVAALRGGMSPCPAARVAAFRVAAGEMSEPHVAALQRRLCVIDALPAPA